MEPDRDEIAAMTDPVLRNLWITQRYHELAVALKGCGIDPDATWCTFAVWASKTAGSVIRGEDLPPLIRHLMPRPAGARLGHGNRLASCFARLTGLFGEKQLVRFAELISSDVAAHIAEGNRLVFAELAAPFEALVEGWPEGPGAAFAAAEATLPSDAESQLLREAFAAYRRAVTCDPLSPDRPLHLLAANVMAVAHEQQRLQPAVLAALDAAVLDTVHKVIEERLLIGLPGPFRYPLDWMAERLAELLEPVCRSAITGLMLRLVTPDGTLDLGSDLPALAAGLWPPELAVLGPHATPFFEWDLTEGTGRPTGADDWSVIGQRMNYIVNLFRSRQRDPSLLDPPFSPAQLAELRAGRLPSGPL